jgi:hypothetical protein
MQYNALLTALTVAIALCVSSCSTQRSLRTEVRSLATETTRDTVREKIVVAVHDTVLETKTITITKNEVGDTTFTSIVTERDRVRDRAAVRDKEEKLIVRTDTVYVAVRDSVSSSKSQVLGNSLSPHPSTLTFIKWIFAIICAIIVLIIVIKFGLRKVF